MATKQNTNTTNPAAHQHGVALAAKMLVELRASRALSCDMCSINSEYREPGKAQRNIVMEHLDLISSPEERAGFTAVLSDYVASCAAGLIPDASTYVEERAP